MAKKIAVIGAGCSGLVGIKSCLEEGLEPVCLERTDDIGGLWKFKGESHDGQACVMKSTVINTSKEMMPYSDFPIPKDYANYMHNTKVWKYFGLYADKFDLRKYIRFKTEVTSVQQSEDFSKSGQWILEVKDLETGDTTTEVYDGVLLCNGHHAEKKIPTFEGMDEFEGKIMHSHDYKDSRGLEDKKVVVIGQGNSGADCVIEISRVASQVFWSTKRGAWVLKRIAPSGLPSDITNTRRFAHNILTRLPASVRNTLIENRVKKQFNHDLYGMTPAHRWNAAHPLVCDDLANRIACGSVQLRPNIKRFTKTGIEFDDGTFEDNVDVVITATGYLFGFPFVKHPGLEVKNNQVNLFKYVFPPDVQPATIGVIGCIQPWGAIMPIAELQCRWAVRVFKGVTFLPEVSEMWSDIREKQAAMAHRYVASTRHTIQVDWIDFMDQVAEQIGCKPEMMKLFLEDPLLAKEVLFGPCTPYQYRIHGPGAWSGAREAIMTQWERILAPTKTRPSLTSKSNNDYVMQIIKLVVLAWILRWLFFG